MFKKNTINPNFSGKILKCPSYKNELWYVNPVNKKRQLITITNAPFFFKKLFISISEIDMAKIPVIGKPENNKNTTIRKKFKGKFIIADGDSTVWYVNESLNRIRIVNSDLLDILSCYAVSVDKEELLSIIK